MSGDGKDAGQETTDEVHPPCTPVELRIEELDREDDHGTELHGHGSSTNTINSKKVSVGNPSDPMSSTATTTTTTTPPSARSPSSLIKQVLQACSIKLRKQRRGSLDQSMVESSHTQDRPPTPDADGHPRSDVERPYIEEPQELVPLSARAFYDSSDSGGSLRNEWIKMRTLDASKDAVVQQVGAAATGNTGSGQGTSCWPFRWWFKKDSKN